WWLVWLAGFAFAFLPLSVFFLIGLWNGWFALRSEIQLEGLGRIALSAIFVGFFEEVLFRGIAFGILIRLLGSFWAGVLVSAFFASVHFLRPGNRVTNEVNWLSGWHQMLAVFDSVPEMPLLAWGWGTLFFIGLILAFAVNRTRSLWHAFGLHAGWIFGQQGINFIAKWSFLGDLSNGVLLLGPTLVSGMVPTGVIPLLVISGCGILSWAWLRRR
ncbi:MAG: CPBP family intramembrane metalloprotease, partial [Chthoniobacterales bacterium]|nr:CPBP family intramembrane metalloprotease [Chthoniobacterales bacterium]